MTISTLTEIVLSEGNTNEAGASLINIDNIKIEAPINNYDSQGKYYFAHFVKTATSTYMNYWYIDFVDECDPTNTDVFEIISVPWTAGTKSIST